jgi:hypothetical protein
MRQVIDTKKNKSQLLTVIGMGLTLLLSSCNNSPNKTTNAEASQKTKEAGKLLPISEGNYWEYKHRYKAARSSDGNDSSSQPSTDYQRSKIEVDSVEETPLKEKIVSLNPPTAENVPNIERKYSIKNKKFRVERFPNLSPNFNQIFKTGSNSGNYSYTINSIRDHVEYDKLNVNVSYQQQQVSVPAGEFKGLRYDFQYDAVGTEKSQTPTIEKVEETLVLVKDIGIVYYQRSVKANDDGAFESLLTDYHVSDKK